MSEGGRPWLGPGRQRFHARIASLQRAVVGIGFEVQRSVAEATDAWLRRDCEAGRRVNARTAGWSERAQDAELAAYELIATQQPMAVDLRRLVALVRLTEAVSRSGDLVAHVARSACFERDPSDFSPGLRVLVVEMSTAAASELGAALSAYLAGDAEGGREVEASDRDLDVLRTELFAALLGGDTGTAPAVDLSLLGRFYERIGDHAVEIARQAGFVSTGGAPGGT